MYSEDVASALKSLGVIADETEFNNYIIDHGYESKLKTGVFELSNKAGYDEIISIICRN